MRKVRMLAGISLVVAYSGIVHFGVLTGYFLPALIVLLLILGFGSAQGIRQGNWGPMVYFVIFSILGYFFLLQDNLVELILAPPVMVNVLLLVVFGSTLMPGSTPLVTQFSQILKGDLNEKALKYTRRVTQAWTIFFFVMTCETLFLVIYASLWTWSLFTNFINYVLIGLFFMFEYFLRARLFREVEHPGFLPFVSSLLAIDLKQIKTL